jgi:amidase
MIDRLGAFCPEPFSPRSGADRGALSGLSFAVKDLIDVRGHVTGAGNPAWAASHAAATADAPVVDRLLGAGATLIGKTVTDELAFSLDGRNAHYGTPINAAAPSRLPGGSSSGSAAAVAGNLADFALGTDTGGSVRVPASFCGLYGFRASHGALPTAGVVPFAPGFDTVGWFARDATLLRRIGEVLLPSAPGAPLASRALLCRDAFAIVDDPPRHRLLSCAGAVLGRGHIVAQASIDLAREGLADWMKAYLVLQGAEIRRALGPWIRDRNPAFGANIAARFATIWEIAETDVAAAGALRADIAARLDTMLADVVLVLPTAPFAAPRRDIAETALGELYPRMLALNVPASLGGLPQVTLPLVSTEDGPIGLSLVGRRGSDRALLALAESLSAGH